MSRKTKSWLSQKDLALPLSLVSLHPGHAWTTGPRRYAECTGDDARQLSLTGCLRVGYKLTTRTQTISVEGGADCKGRTVEGLREKLRICRMKYLLIFISIFYYSEMRNQKKNSFCENVVFAK